MMFARIFPILLVVYFISGAASNNRQNFCQQDRCLTCIGRYCTTTCQGEYCKSCPLGDCCDGTNCNICRGEKCCTTADCNDCVINCLKECQGKTTCHYDCFQRCLPNGQNGDVPNENQPYGHYGPSLISNKNYLPVNVTTIINITNTIDNENVFHHPILINTTNVNNYTGQKNYHRKHVIISTENGDDKKNTSINNHTETCCEVVHPERCQKIQKQTDRLCYTRKHRECSQLCTGKYIHIVEDKEQKHQCVVIAEEPHWYCGHYVVENCDSCYNCADIDDTECTQSPNCSDRCRSSIISEEFYNKLYRKE